MYNKYEIKTYTDNIKNEISDLENDKKKFSTNNNINNNTDIEKDKKLETSSKQKSIYTNENKNINFYQSTSKDNYRNLKNKNDLTPLEYKKVSNNKPQLAISSPQKLGEEQFSYNYTAINRKTKNKSSNKITKISNNSTTQRVNLNEKYNQREKKEKKSINSYRRQIDPQKSENFKMISFRPIEYDSDINYNLNKNRPKLIQTYKKEEVEEMFFPSKKTYSPPQNQEKYQPNTLKFQSFFGSFNSTKNSKSTSRIKINQLNDFNIDKLIEIGDKYVNLGKPVLPLGKIMNDNILYNKKRIKNNKKKIQKKNNNYNYINNDIKQFDSSSNFGQRYIIKYFDNDIPTNKSHVLKEKKRVMKKIISKNNLKNSITLNDENKFDQDKECDNDIKKNLNFNSEIKKIKSTVKIKKNSLKKYSKDKLYEYNLDSNKNDDGNQNVLEVSQNNKIYQKKSNLKINKKDINSNSKDKYNQKLNNNLDNNRSSRQYIKNVNTDDENNYTNSLYNKKKIIQNKELQITDNKKYNKISPKVYYKDTKRKNYYGCDERHNLEDTIDNHAYFESVYSKKIINNVSNDKVV